MHPVRLAILGNSGSGKSTLAHGLAASQGIPVLELDELVWERGKIAVPRPIADVTRELDAFVSGADAWVVEGCYGELITHIAPRLSELLFLNPGLATCLANNRRRPWEKHKYASAAVQDSMLPNLLAWVEGYYTRDDHWSLKAHRALFDAHPGAKRELVTLAAISAELTRRMR